MWSGAGRRAAGGALWTVGVECRLWSAHTVTGAGHPGPAPATGNLIGLLSFYAAGPSPSPTVGPRALAGPPSNPKAARRHQTGRCARAHASGTVATRHDGTVAVKSLHQVP